MLWDLIRDFFVQYVFGGVLSDETFISATIGADIDDFTLLDGGNYIYKISDNLSISLSDWLSTTATIITISIIVVLCCLFVYKIIKLIGGLIR